jgi:hypothetical protein
MYVVYVYILTYIHVQIHTHIYIYIYIPVADNTTCLSNKANPCTRVQHVSRVYKYFYTHNSTGPETNNHGWRMKITISCNIHTQTHRPSHTKHWSHKVYMYVLVHMSAWCLGVSRGRVHKNITCVFLSVKSHTHLRTQISQETSISTPKKLCVCFFCLWGALKSQMLPMCVCCASVCMMRRRRDLPCLLAVLQRKVNIHFIYLCFFRRQRVILRPLSSASRKSITLSLCVCGVDLSFYLWAGPQRKARRQKVVPQQQVQWCSCLSLRVSTHASPSLMHPTSFLISGACTCMRSCIFVTTIYLYIYVYIYIYMKYGNTCGYAIRDLLYTSSKCLCMQMWPLKQ